MMEETPNKTKYIIDGQTYFMPSDMSEDEVLEAIYGMQDASAGDEPVADTDSTSSVTSYDGSLAEQDRSWWSTLFGDIDEEDLQYDPQYVEAGRLLWRASNPNSDAELTDREAAEYATNMQGWFAYNLPRQALDVGWLASQDEDTRKAFLYTMDKYEYLGFSLRGTDRFIKGMAADPLTYVGLSTFGLGTVAGTATKVASRAALRQALRTGITLGVESAATSVGDNVLRQNVRVLGGVQDEVSTGQAVGAGVGGFLTGGALGAAGSLAGTAVRGLTKGTNVAPAPDQKTIAADGAGQKVELELPQELQLELPMELPEVKPRKTPVEQEADELINELPWNKDQLNLPLDNPNDIANPIVKSVKENASTSGAQVRIDLKRGAAPTRDVILNLDDDELGKVVSEALRGDFSPEGNVLLGRSLKEATDALLGEIRSANSIAEAFEVEKRLNPIRNASNLLATQASDALRSYQGGPNIGDFRKVSVDSILEEQKITRDTASPDQLNTAMEEFQRRIAAQDRVIAARPEVQRLSDEVDQLVDKGDIATAIQKNAEKEALMDKIADDTGVALGERKSNKLLQTAGLLGRGAVEVSISNVMSLKSVWRNVVPTVYETYVGPAMSTISEGLSGPSRARAMAHYSALRHAQSHAWKAAKLAWESETPILPMKHRKGSARAKDDIGFETNRITEMRPVIPRKYGGGIIRLFPRLTNTTDEFFSQMNYQAAVAGDIAARAWDEGTAKGLKGKALKAYIKSKVDKFEEHAYENASSDSIISFLRRMGIENGLSGKKLDDWIATRLAKDKDVLKIAISRTGLDFADDLAFRKVFSGSNWASKVANSYQEIVNNYPLLKLSGQLFFKTPVRVFQAGIRLTPGVNLIADPTFIRDLAGRGPGGEGGHAQRRAYVSAMMSTVFLTSAMMMYANGQLTGSGFGENYRQKKSSQNPDFEPYTIDIGGYKFNYQYYEPIATPLKILANTFEKMEMLEYRKAQGEDVTIFGSYYAAVAQTAALGVFQAIEDAALWEGLSQLMKLGTDINEGNENALIKWLGQKLQMAVPSTITHAQQAFGGDGSRPDNAELTDFVLSKLDPYSASISRIHGPVGNIVTKPQGFSSMLGLEVSSPESRTTGDPKLDNVLGNLADLTLQTGKNWIASYKAQDWASGTGIKGLDFDLRTRMTSDGTETMYDRLQRYVYETDIVDRLNDIFEQYGHMPGGTPSNPGILTKAVEDRIKMYRRQAFLKLWQEEKEDLIPMFMDTVNKSYMDQTGPNMPSLFNR